MRKQAGFTLIELLVVIAIIGILAGVILASLSSARAKAQDAKTKAELHQIQTALELYYDQYGTYQVANSGYTNGGQGFVTYSGGGGYTVSISDALAQAGFLGAIPMQNPSNYMMYLCPNNQYSLSATLNYPSPQDIAHAQTTCNATGANGTYTFYGKNYSVSNF